MSKTLRVALIVTVAVFALAAAGTTIGLLVADTDGNASASTATGTPNPNAIECASIDRAYNSWAIGRLTDAYDYEAVNEVSMKTEIDEQKELLEAVQGYNGQPSKDLAAAVAIFGAELAVLNAELVIAGQVSADQSAVVAGEQRKLRQQYAAWKTATCS